MPAARRFLLANMLWAAAITLLIVPINLLARAGDFMFPLRWFAHSLVLGAFPAGLMVARQVFDDANPRARLLEVAGASMIVAAATFVLFAFVGPALGNDPGFFQLLAALRQPVESWQVRNHNLWAITLTLGETVSVLLLAGIGLQLGAWCERALSPAARRVLYWAAGLFLIVSSYSITDSTYEAIVVKTDGPVEFAGLYTLLIPAALFAGLLIPTLTLLRAPHSE